MNTQENHVVVKGFSFFKDGFCDNDSCQAERPEVYQCPICTETFCDGCTDLEAWQPNLECPQCGKTPSALLLTED